MLRKHIWFGLLLVAVLMLAACAPTTPAQAPAADSGQAAQPAADAPAADTGPCVPATDGEFAGVDPRGQTIVWWHNHTGSREERLQEILEGFADNECGIVIEALSQGDYDDIRDKVNASIAAGEQPAALVVGYQNDQQFYQINDALVDLNSFIDDPTWGLTEEERADFYSGFLEQSVHPLFDNQRLGFPPNRSMAVLYYNQTWLEELGFSGPPTTPDEFKEMACAAAEANGDGTGGYILSDSASAVAAWTYAFGGDLLNEDKTGYMYNGPGTVESMTFLKGMLDEGCAYIFTEGYSNPQFAARKAIFTYDSSSALPFYQTDIDTVAQEQNREPDVWGVAAFPHTTPDPVQNIYGGDVMITVTTPEQELAAWNFVKWFTSPEIQAEWARATGYFPTRESSTELLADYVDENPQWGQALALLPYSYYEPQFISYAAVRDAASNAFNEIMQGADIQTTLDNLTEFANETHEELMAEIE